MRHLVFVFGTLKEGFPNFHVNAGTRVGQTFRTRERFPLFLVGERHVPWMLAQPGAGLQVLGQVFEVNALTLRAMDDLEQIHEPDGYRRVEIEVEEELTSGQNQGIKVFAYLKPAEHLTVDLPRVGPLSEYTAEHAELYRPRAG